MVEPFDVENLRKSLGRDLARWRSAAGHTQWSFAPEIQYTRSTIANVETGRQPAPREFWERCDTTLGANGHLLRAHDRIEQLRRDVRRAAASTADAVPDHSGAMVGAVRSFRAADKKIGGGYLYATVIRYLQTQVAPNLFGIADVSDGPQGFNVAAALTEMAGWMAHDAGQQQIAQNHFARSSDLMRSGRDDQLRAHIFGSMSHLALHHGESDRAIDLARRGQKVMRRSRRNPDLNARLLALQARGFAGLRRVDECREMLSQAEGALMAKPLEERSPWVSSYDEGALALDAARCFRQLGDLGEARRQASRMLTLRPGDRVRSRAFGQLALVTVLLAQGRADEACSTAMQVLKATESLGSYLVLRQILSTRKPFEIHRSNPAVARYLEHLDILEADRVRFYPSLFAGTSDQSYERGGIVKS